MKAIQIVLGILIVVGLGALATQKIWVPKLVDKILAEENSAIVKESVGKDIIADGKYCFSRTQKDTMGGGGEGPYAYEVSENVALNIAGVKVTGTKSGTQNGPDMNNGYTGTLEGLHNGNNFELLYSYTIEGSKNKEKEIYEWKNSALNKLRYELEDKNGVLTPKREGEPQVVTYEKVDCK